MRRMVIVFTILMCFGLFNLASAEEQMILPTIPAVLLLPEGVYSPVLTPDNLDSNQAFIFSRGGTVEGWKEEFKLRGILLKAYDDSNNRVLIVTGLQDEDGQRYGDIDLQSPQTRAEYRSLYQKDGPFETKGYRVESAEWKNFKQVGRFLMLRYSFRENGEVVYRGFARRSVKNGFSVMIDMQVFGRTLKAGDNTALNKVFDSLNFTGNSEEGTKAIPVFLNETASAPAETNKSEFTLKGITRAGAKLTATLMSFTSNTPANFSATADAKGGYSLPIKLLNEGIYMMSLSVESQGLTPMEKTYSITYGRGLLPVVFTSQFPEELSQDKYTISGITEPGVTVQMILNGENISKNSNSKGAFSFSIKTISQGIYQLRLSFEKKGFNTRLFDFTGVKGLEQTPGPSEGGYVNTSGESESAVTASSGDPLSPSYTELIAMSDSYKGKLLTYDGFITDMQEGSDGYIISIALRKAPTGFADTVKLVMAESPGFISGDKVRVYGLLEDDASEENLSLDLSYPMLRVQSITLLEQQKDTDV